MLFTMAEHNKKSSLGGLLPGLFLLSAGGALAALHGANFLPWR